jgi:hypothetical protein
MKGMRFTGLPDSIFAFHKCRFGFLLEGLEIKRIIFHGNLGYSMYGHFPVLVCYTKENLSTPAFSRLRKENEQYFFKLPGQCWGSNPRLLF